jgi:hypothetical protein
MMITRLLTRYRTKRPLEESSGQPNTLGVVKLTVDARPAGTAGSL